MLISRELQSDLEQCAASHRQLFDALDGWAASGDPTVPSRLPGWTIGHVLAHLANNARALTGILRGAAAGEVAEMYAGGAEGRDAAIEVGSRRAADELVADVRASAEELERTWPAEDWSGAGRHPTGRLIEVAGTPILRVREVEVHRVDLGIGYEPRDWPAYYVRRDLRLQEMTAKSRLPMGGTGWPAAVLELDPPTRLAWLLGRHRGEGLPELGN